MDALPREVALKQPPERPETMRPGVPQPAPLSSHRSSSNLSESKSLPRERSPARRAFPLPALAPAP